MDLAKSHKIGEVALLQKRVRLLIITFIVGLILSGVTAFPIERQLAFAVENMDWMPSPIFSWINRVYLGISRTNASYPFISYGTDWLAFAHIVLAINFIGPYIDPVKNIWVIQFGLIACVSIFPLALIAGEVRQIPFYWRLIDCSFGLIGGLILYWCYRMILRLEQLAFKEK